MQQYKITDRQVFGDLVEELIFTNTKFKCDSENMIVELDINSLPEQSRDWFDEMVMDNCLM